LRAVVAAIAHAAVVIIAIMFILSKLAK
jgi:hypothetical protein